MEPKPLSSMRRGRHISPSPFSSQLPPSTPPGRSGTSTANNANERVHVGSSERQSWSSVTQDSVVDTLLSSFDRMPGSGSGSRRGSSGTSRTNTATTMMMDDDFDRSSTSFTPPRSFQRLQQRVRGSTFSSSLSHESDSNSTASQRTARNELHSRGSTIRTNDSFTDRGHQYGRSVDSISTNDSSSYDLDHWSHTQGTPDVVSNPILNRGRPVPSLYSTFGTACPEPKVPKGPTKANDGMARSAAANADIPQSIREQALEFVRQANLQNHPDHVAGTSASAPALSSSLYKQSSATDAPKERPGFFRRVFGSSNRANSTTDQQRSTARDSAALSIESASSAGPVNPLSDPIDTTTTTATATASPPPVVTKKASFFRRRKKSMTDSSRPPALPATLFTPPATRGSGDPFEPASPSASSLRMVMNQYLSPAEAQLAQTSSVEPSASKRISSRTDEDEEISIFHSGYASPPDGSLEPVEATASVSFQNTAEPPSLRYHNSQPTDQVKRDRLYLDTTETARPQNNSFLSDTSEVDDGSRAQSFISAVSDNYLADDTFSPISPMAQPVERFVTPDAVSPMSDSDNLSPIDYFAHPAKQSLRSVPSDSDSVGLPREGIKPSRSKLATIDAQKYLASSLQSSLPIFQVDGNEVRPSVEVARGMLGTIDEPTADERERAQKIYNGDEQHITKEGAAPWLGEKNPVSARTLTAYMDLFNFTGQNILIAMRSLCDRLVLKGESQQVDRILDAFSHRWDECNSNNGFKGPSVVHAICYALLLLNTDQHLADIQHKMTRSEFIKNTMPAVKDAAESATVRPLKIATRSSLPWQETTTSAPPDLNEEDERVSADFRRSFKRLSYRPGMGRFDTDPGPNEHGETGSANFLVNHVFEGPERAWLVEVEGVLKAFYSSVVAEALPLHGSQNTQESLGTFNGSSNLNPTNGTLRRTGSIISKAPSEGYSYRSRKDPSILSSRWQNKNRPRQKIYSASTAGSTRTSIDDGQSAWSPSAQSSMWSKISMGRTQTTMSVDSFAVHPDFKQSLGFTNALSQAIIREEGSGDNESIMKIGAVLEDESLELAGAPWAKEGMVKHKHHLEGPDKKSKERSWNECFAVVEKGYIHLFSFNRNSTKITNARANNRRQPGKAASIAPSVVGGGNWTDNAEELGQFLLRQTLATVLPHPGYSKTRPYVWALSLPTGAVHLFQVGTAEIAEEFVSTANYWSARLSKEPLMGGVDNIEYGWSDNIINPALVGHSNGDEPTKPPSKHGPHHSHSTSVNSTGGRISMQSSIRGSFDQSFGSRSRLAGDRAHINDWKPPAASMLPSQLLEIDQLRSLKAYVSSVETELERHNELRNAVNLAYTNRSSNNWGKVISNWEKKSSYLLREVVKFRTYIEALEKATHAKAQIYEERRIREEERTTARLIKENTKA